MTLRGLANQSAREFLAENCWCLGMQGAGGVVAMKRSMVCGKGLATMKAGEGHRTVHQAEAGNPAFER